jgi:hypothetical protein
MDILENPPNWAKSWCYYFLAAGMIPIIAVFLLIVGSPRVGLGVVFLYLFAALIQSATFLTLFWMCRKSLA